MKISVQAISLTKECKHNESSVLNAHGLLYRKYKKLDDITLDSVKVSALHDMLIEDEHISAVLTGADTILPDDVKQTICGATRLHADNILNQLRELQVDLHSNPAIFIGGGSILLRPFLEQSPLVAKADFVDNPNANALGYEMLGNQKLHILTQAPGSERLA